MSTKGMRLSDFRKRSDQWYRNNLGIVQRGRKSRETIEYILERSLNALPQGLQEFIEDRQQTIESMANIIIHDGSLGQIEPYEAIKQFALYQRKKTGYNTHSHIYSVFRTQAPSIYAKYNSYMYRLGYSASKYFHNNANYQQEGSTVRVIISLPRGKVVVYNILEIVYDFSGGHLEAFMH